MKKTRLNIHNKDINEINEWISHCIRICTFKEIPRATKNQKDFVISILTAIWLLRFLTEQKDLKNFSDISSKIDFLKDKYPDCYSIWDFIYIIFKTLHLKDILTQILSFKIPNLEKSFQSDSLGVILQRSLVSNYRKKIAANYTNLTSANILVTLIDNYQVSKIVDPFCGSGRLITSYLEKLNSNSFFPKIRINDLMASAVLLASCRIALILHQKKKDFNLLEATIGNAFLIFNPFEKNKITYDLLLMNPPFTRTHRIDNYQKTQLKKLNQYYEENISGQLGLHIYSLLLADLLVEEGGIIAAVLPAATIQSKYSSGIQKLLLKNYVQVKIATSTSQKSHSEDSSFNEILFIAKRHINCNNEEMKFLRINESKSMKSWTLSSIQRISKQLLQKEWNWTIFLREPELLKLREKIINTNLVKNGKDLGLDIIRGVEMYGPHFFFIPNKKWSIIKINNGEIIIRSDQKNLLIPKQYLVKILRKPSNYSRIISPKVNDYALSIENKNIKKPNWLQEYLLFMQEFSILAIRKFKEDWLSHINTQLLLKNPIGHLFLIDKFGISATSVMCHYLDTKLPCSKNFYVIRNFSSEQSKLLAAWLNSTFFIILFIVCRREIGGSYGRLQIIDYMKEPLFFDFSACDKDMKDQIIAEFDKIRKVKLPPIPLQIKLHLKKPLDLAIAHGLQFTLKEAEKFLTDAYMYLEKFFGVLAQLDKNK